VDDSTVVSPVLVCEIDELETHIQRQLGGRVRDFRLVLRAKGLVLQGHAHNYHAKQLAQHAVIKTTILPIIANEIEVS
jgi:hypothetical protein